jgi:nucleoside-diphosphate-sugar epimerase
LSTKLLVTGGTGFLGAYIIKHLVEKGYAVRAIRRRPQLPAFIPAHIFDKVEWVPGDVLDPASLEEAMEGVHAVIHSAAIVSFTPADRLAMYQTNVDGTANVVNAAVQKKVSRFVHISSVAALGRTAGGATVTEDREWQDNKINTHYAISKRFAEMEVWRGMGEGLRTVILNPSTIIGYGDWHTSSCAIFKSVYDEFPWYTTGINGFVAVHDVAAAAVALMESAVSGERFIINGDNWSFQQLFDSIAGGFHKKKPHRQATPFLGEIAWRIEKFKAMFTGKKPLLTRESARVAQSKTFFDNSKLLKTLPGFSFTPLPVAIGLACDHYLQRL